MKNILFFITLGLTILFSACSSDSPVAAAPEEEEDVIAPSKTITITVGMPERPKKSRVIFDDKTLKFTWDNQDCLTVLGYGPKGYLGTSEFTLTAGAGQLSATFIGKTIAGATSYVVYYKTPNLSFNPKADAMHAATMAYDGQTQNTRRATVHLKDYLFLQSQQMTAEQFENGKFGLKMQNSIMRFNILSSPADMGRIKSVVWENNPGTTDAHATALTLESLDIDGHIDSFGDQGSTVLPMAADGQNLEEIVVFLCFDSEAMELKANQALTVRLNGSRKTYQVDIVPGGGMTYKPGSRYRASISLTGGEGHLSNWHEIL